MTYYDPYDAAMNAKPREATPRWYGQLFIDVWTAALVKGQGKVPFDQTQHKSAVTAIDMSLVPVAEHGVSFNVERSLIAESRSWTSVTLPSIKALNVDLRTLHGRWCAVELKETGRTYQSNGETRSETAMDLVAVFADEAACHAAYEVYYNTDAAVTESTETTAPVVDPQRAVAVQFIGPLWKQAAGDVSALEQLLAGNPLTSRFLTITSPEVMAVIGGAA